jgi:hypothetical protein
MSIACYVQLTSLQVNTYLHVYRPPFLVDSIFTRVRPSTSVQQIPKPLTPLLPLSAVLIRSGEGLPYYQSHPGMHSCATSPSPGGSQWSVGPLFAGLRYMSHQMHSLLRTGEDSKGYSDYFHYVRRALSFVLFHEQALYHITLCGNGIPKRTPSESIVAIVSSAARISAKDSRLTSITGYPNVLASAARRFRNRTLDQVYELVLPHDECSSTFILDAAEEQIISRRFEFFMHGLPAFARGIVSSADPEGLVRRMLPPELVPPGARYIATCFWAWLCVIDGELARIVIHMTLCCTWAYFSWYPDLTEESNSSNSLEQCVASLSRTPYEPPSRGNSDCMHIMNAFHRAVSTTTLYSARHNINTVVESWKSHFWREVLGVVKALQAEKSLRGRSLSLQEWMSVRQLTISGA